MELLNIDVLGCSKAETGCPWSEIEPLHTFHNNTQV